MYVPAIRFTNPVLKNNVREQNFNGNLYSKRDFLTTLREMRHINGSPRFNLGEINPIADNILSTEGAETVKWLAKLTDKNGKYRFNGQSLTVIGSHIKSKEDAKLVKELVELTDKNGNLLYNCCQIEELMQSVKLNKFMYRI